MRILIAGIVGGIVMFMWGAFSHMVIGMGEAGVKNAPNEPAVVAALKANLTEPGFYFVPGMDMSREQTAEEKAAWTAAYTTGPNAIIVYHPTGETPMSPRQFGVELGSNIAAALIVALFFTWLTPSFSKRVALATLVGLVAWLSVNVSYWNWYRFPGSMMASELIEELIGWFLVGLVMAFIVRSGRT
ncbi:MAG: hypothetical protein ABI539_02300 [Acidobacteriota bacterium]